MNYVLRRFAELLITHEKYSEFDLHTIKNCLCFLRDSEDTPEESAKGERFLAEFIRLKEAGEEVDAKQLQEECWGKKK